jgi:outer membrane autotransporter protein
VSFTGIISGGGAVRQSGTGTTVLTADNTYSGGTTITAGTLAGSASSFGAGGVLDNSALIIDQRTEAAFSNPIDGTGSFTKSGAGSLDLTGASALTGATNVVAGRLTVSGSLARSIVTVRDGATLGGMGTVGGIVALGGATVAPGNPMGTLNVKGGVSLAAGSVYQVTADAAGQSDRIATSGAATISGGEVRVLAVSGEFAPTNQYTILAASDGITGRFASVTSNFAFLTPALSYGAAEVRLSLARSEVSFTSIGRTRNQIATAAAAERLGAGNAIYDAILPLDAPSARTAFDALSGEVHASIRGMQLDDGRFVRDAAIDRLWAALGDGSGAAPPAMAYGERGPEPAARSGRFVLWGRAFGARWEAESNGNAATFDGTTGGFLAGGDAPIGENARFGFFGGYSHSSFDAADRASTGDSESYHLGLYIGAQWGSLGLRAGAAYSWSDITTRRVVGFPGFSDSLKSDYQAGTAQTFGEFDYRIDVGRSVVAPFAGLAHLALETEDFTEKGGAAALAIRKDRSAATFSALGVRVVSNLAIGGMKVAANGTVGWQHAFGDIIPTAYLAFDDGDAFTVSGVALAEDAAVIDVGLDIALAPSTTLDLSYGSQFGDGIQGHSARATLSLRF